jgi:hypothetical protein
MLPAVTMAALIVGELMGGALITEEVFGRNGIGSVMYQAVSTRTRRCCRDRRARGRGVRGRQPDRRPVAPLLDPRVRLGGRRPAGGGRGMSIAIAPPATAARAGRLIRGGARRVHAVCRAADRCCCPSSSSS